MWVQRWESGLKGNLMVWGNQGIVEGKSGTVVEQRGPVKPVGRLFSLFARWFETQQDWGRCQVAGVRKREPWG